MIVPNRQSDAKAGTVLSVRGSVIDASFRTDLSPVHSELRAGFDGEIIVEVVSHLSPETFGGIALSPTRRLSRGSTIRQTGKPLRVPVGQQLLGRMFDVFCRPIAECEWRSIYCERPKLIERVTRFDVFETGINAINRLAPLERGGGIIAVTLQHLRLAVIVDGRRISQF